MDITSYQETIRMYANYHKDLGPFTLVLSLGKHYGDFADKLFKILEMNDGDITDEDKFKLGISLGDMMNDISNMAADLDMSMDDILKINIRKLEMANNKIMNNENRFET